MNFRAHRFPILALGLFLSTACAGSSAHKSRDYERENLSALPLQAVTLVVEAKPGFRKLQDDLPSDALFDPPAAEDPVQIPDGDPAMRKALEDTLTETLQALGYTVEIGAHQPGKTLEDWVKSSQNPVLVVRALPVHQLKRFTLHITTEDWVQSDGVNLRHQEYWNYLDPEVLHGRLLLGQAFLWAPQSGLRLWSRQLPEWPTHNRIITKSPIQDYGLLKPRSEALPPDVDREAASRFSKLMLATFPASNDVPSSAWARVNPSEAEAQNALNDFLDEPRYLVSLGATAGWTQLVAVPDLIGAKPLHASDLMPNGSYGLQFKFAMLRRGLNPFVELNYQWIPVELDQILYKPNPQPTASDPHDHAVRIRLKGARQVGGAAGYRLSHVLGTHLLLTGDLGVFFSFTDFDSEGLVQPSSLQTLGLSAGLGLQYIPNMRRPVFIYGEAAARAGFHLSAPAGSRQSFGLGGALHLGLGYAF